MSKTFIKTTNFQCFITIGVQFVCKQNYENLALSKQVLRDMRLCRHQRHSSILVAKILVPKIGMLNIEG